MTIGEIDEDKVIITPEDAESLLLDGDTVHNYANPGMNMFIGCNYSKEDAIKAFKSALAIEIAGPHCKSMKHPLAVWSDKHHVTFFEADMAKVEAFERSRGPGMISDA